MNALCRYVLAFLCLAVPSFAQVNPLFGVGHRTCESWFSDKGTINQAEDGQWLSGFLTGMVAMRYAITKQNLVYNGGNPSDWVDAYCQSHPTSELQDAATAFFFNPGTFLPSSSQ